MYNQVEGKTEILRRAKKLKESVTHKQVFIQPDLTKLDKELRDEVKRLRAAGETDVKIKAGKVVKNT